MQYGKTRGALLTLSVLVIAIALVMGLQPSQAVPLPMAVPTATSTTTARVMVPAVTAVTARPAPAAAKVNPTLAVAVYRAKISHQPLWWAKLWVAYPYWVYKFGTCVAHHESWHAGLWRAQNHSSSASGFAQWLTSTWRTHLKRAGLKGYSRAKYAPPAIQVRAFAVQVMKYGKYPWKGTHCAPGL